MLIALQTIASSIRCFLHFIVTFGDMQIAIRCLGIATDESDGILYSATSSMVSIGEFITDGKSRHQPEAKEIS